MINVAINRCYMAASGLLQSTPLPFLKVETNFLHATEMLLKISVRMASKTITDDYDGLHKMLWDEINKTKDKK